MALMPGNPASYNLAPTDTLSDPKKKIAQIMIEQGLDSSPIRSPWQGVGRVAQAIAGTLIANRAEDDERAEKLGGLEMIRAYMGGGSAQPALVPVAPTASTPTVTPSVPMSGDPQASPDLASAVKKFEGFAPVAQWDFKQNTNGYGTRAAYPGERIDRPEADRRFADEIAKARGSVEAFAPNAPAGVKDALTSLTFNAGTKWQQAGLGQDIQAGKFDSARDRFLAYNKAGGQVLPALVSRRQQEASWFNRPDQPQGDAEMPPNAMLAQGQMPMGGRPQPTMPMGGQPSGRDRINAIMPLMSNKYSAPFAQQMLMKQLEHEQNASRPLTDPNDRARYGIQASDQNPYQIDANGKVTAINPQPFAVNVNQQQESEFRKKAGALQAERFNDLAAEGRGAQQLNADVEMLRDLGSRFATGKTAEIKSVLGPYADALGIKVDNLSDIQAFESVVNRVAPSLRVKGSGAQSDMELRNFLKSLPTLGNTPEGNEIVAATTQGMISNKLKAAEIGARALSGEISSADAEKQIRDLPDPMADWRKAQKQMQAPKAESGLIKVTSPDEARKLPKGTKIILPDGSQGVVP